MCTLCDLTVIACHSFNARFDLLDSSAGASISPAGPLASKPTPKMDGSSESDDVSYILPGTIIAAYKM